MVKILDLLIGMILIYVEGISTRCTHEDNQDIMDSSPGVLYCSQVDYDTLRNKTNAISAKYYTIAIVAESNLTTIDASLFRGFGGLRRLDISSNNVQIVANRSFSDLGMLENLILNNNQIKHLNKDNFKDLTQLKRLDLSYNHIELISPNLFQYLVSLFSLKLNNNHIKDVRPTPFANLVKLYFIDLSFNQILYLEENIFYDLNSLSKVNMANNHISGIHLHVFRQAPNLEIIVLENNNITTLDDGMFDKSIKLRMLKLANNSITRLESNLFSNTKNMQVLDISNNQIEILENDTFNGLTKLRKIDLKSNRLKQIKGEFSACSNLRELYFSNNNISFIQMGAFQSQQQLIDLDISRNKLTRVNYGVFTGLNKLERLNISNNLLNVSNNLLVILSLHNLASLSIIGNVMEEKNMFQLLEGNKHLQVELGNTVISCDWLSDMDNKHLLNRIFVRRNTTSTENKAVETFKGVECVGLVSRTTMKPKEEEITTTEQPKTYHVLTNILEGTHVNKTSLSLMMASSATELNLRVEQEDEEVLKVMTLGVHFGVVFMLLVTIVVVFVLAVYMKTRCARKPQESFYRRWRKMDPGYAPKEHTNSVSLLLQDHSNRSSVSVNLNQNIYEEIS